MTSPDKVFDDALVQSLPGRPVLPAPEVDLEVDPLQPPGRLGSAIDRNEPLHHPRPPPRQSQKNVGPEADPEAHAGGQAVVMQDTFNLAGRNVEK